MSNDLFIYEKRDMNIYYWIFIICSDKYNKMSDLNWLFNQAFIYLFIIYFLDKN